MQALPAELQATVALWVSLRVNASLNTVLCYSSFGRVLRVLPISTCYQQVAPCWGHSLPLGEVRIHVIGNAAFVHLHTRVEIEGQLQTYFQALCIAKVAVQATWLKARPLGESVSTTAGVGLAARWDGCSLLKAELTSGVLTGFSAVGVGG